MEIGTLENKEIIGDIAVADGDITRVTVGTINFSNFGKHFRQKALEQNVVVDAEMEIVLNELDDGIVKKDSNIVEKSIDFLSGVAGKVLAAVIANYIVS